MSSTTIEFSSLKDIAEKAGFNIPEYSEVDKRKGADFLNIDLGENKKTYIRFAALLEFLEKTQLLYTKQSDPLIKFDYRIGINYMITNKWIISANPNVCLINPGSITLLKELENLGDSVEQNNAIFRILNFFTGNIPISTYLTNLLGDEIITTFKVLDKLPEFKDKDLEYKVGDIMNIFLEVDFVFNTLLENLDNKTGITPIFKFLDSICSAINNTLGNLSSISPFIDEKTNLLSIIEEGELPNKEKILDKLELNNKNIPLQLFGYNNINSLSPQSGFVKSFNLKTEITNDLASMVTIGAQASGQIVKGMDATAFASWNKGLVDRIIPIKKEIPIEEDSEDDSEDELTKEEKLLKKYQNGLTNYVNLLNAYYKGDFDFDEISSYSSGLKSIIQYEKELIQLEKETKNNGKTISVTQQGFLPINLNLTLDGISGPVILQQFETEGRFLPHPIPDTLTFLIKGISHKISNNIWTTTIDSLSVPKFIKSTPKQKIKPSKTPIVSTEEAPLAYPTAADSIIKDQATNTERKPIGEINVENGIAIDIIKAFEKFKSKPYLDANQPGVWTIGYGTIKINGKRVTGNTPPITEIQATQYLLSDVQTFINSLKKGLNGLEFTQNEFDALLSLTYNVGSAWTSNTSSTMRRLLFDGDYLAAADEIRTWKWASGKVNQGLVNRREAERTLFLTNFPGNPN